MLTLLSFLLTEKQRQASWQREVRRRARYYHVRAHGSDISLPSQSLMQQHQHQVINGTDTDVIIQRYNDRTMVLVTQLGKVGNLVPSFHIHTHILSLTNFAEKIQASIPPTTSLPPPPTLPEQLPPPLPAIQLTPLLGSASSEHLQTLHSLYASQIATLAWAYEPPSTADLGRKSVVVGLALKKVESGDDGLSEDEKTTFRGIMALVQDMLKQYVAM